MTNPSRPSLLYAEDAPLGAVIELGDYLVTSDEIIAFAQHWDPLPFHTDPLAAEASFFAGLVASGAHTLCIFQRLAVTGALHQWAILAARTLREIELRRPVRPGTRLRADLRADGLRHLDTNRSAIVFHGRLWDGNAEVLRITIDGIMHRRPLTDP